MTVQFSVRMLAGGKELDARLVPLLRAISSTGSLNQAVAALRLSYRYAWGLLGKATDVIGQPLVVMERGRGAKLSLLGEKLVAADQAANRMLAHELAGTAEDLNREVAASRRHPVRPLVIHASHDLALASLRDQFSDSKDLALDLHFRGSLECLADLARGACDLAGFHVADISGGAEPYRAPLRLRSLALVRFVTRNQGLMVAAGNPRNLRTLADLAASGARFINRQPGSGTRLCFDQLLAAARIRPARINGYQVEEFTHAAVAATIASGMADAGLGIEAAARQHGLGFVPLASERYYLAARAATLARPDAQTLLAALKDPAFHERVSSLAGYRATDAGKMVSVREVLKPAGGESG
jgi:molybdate transport repressor ModE-like protein